MIKTIIIGFIAGLIARAIKPGHNAGWIGTIILGIAGAWVGQYIAKYAGINVATDMMNLGVSVFGAFILLSLSEVIFGGR